MSAETRFLHPAAWVPTSYFAEGIPYAMVNWVAGTMFKDLGHSDSEITLATGLIGLLWAFKPLWAAFLDMYRTKKFWVLASEFFMTALLAAVALALHLPSYFGIVVLVLWVLAFASATHDICVDGVYITTLSKKGQAQWVGMQGMCWNTGRIFGTAVVVWVAGRLKRIGYDSHGAWTLALGLSAVAMGALGVYHRFTLPTGSIPVRPKNSAEILAGFAEAFVAFFRKKAIWGMLIFVFLYRTGEGFLLLEAPLFMQSKLQAGGLGLTLEQKSVVDGTVSTIVGIVAGLLGGAFASKYGLKRTLLFLAICLNVPHLCYVFLSQAVTPEHPLSMTTVMLLVCIEKFGYGFGFVGNMLYMMQQIAPGKFKMTHFAFATGIMQLVLVPTEAYSGPLADWLGYKTFFIFVLIASIPSIIAAWRAPFPNPPDVDDDPQAGSGDATPQSSATAAA
jgi:PAT family beta-lactamase induction signal transducer AmpG